MTSRLFIPRKTFAKNLGKQEEADELANYLAIERWANTLVSAFVVFSFKGVLGATGQSARLTMTGAGTFSTVILSETTPGTTASVFTVYKNGTSLGTFTLPLSTATTSISFAIQYQTNDYFTVACTTAGTGASDATVQLA